MDLESARNRLAQAKLEGVRTGHTDIAETLLSQVDRLRAVLTRAREVLALCGPPDGEIGLTAKYPVPEDAPVLALCKLHGFGAVMGSAARQWAECETLGRIQVKGSDSAFTTGPCRYTVRKALAEIDEALRDESCS